MIIYVFGTARLIFLVSFVNTNGGGAWAVGPAMFKRMNGSALLVWPVRPIRSSPCPRFGLAGPAWTPGSARPGRPYQLGLPRAAGFARPGPPQLPQSSRLASPGPARLACPARLAFLFRFSSLRDVPLDRGLKFCSPFSFHLRNFHRIVPRIPLGLCGLVA